MSKYFLLQDQKNCIGCFSCEVHCKSWKGLPKGPRLGQVMPVGPKMMGELPRAAYIFMPCFHCEDPWCVPACPTGAMRKRPSDGIVYVESSLCVGCKSCITACPWGAPQWNPETGKAVKCDYCMDRVDQGLKPACVTKCVTHCLKFGVADQMDQSRRERTARIQAYELDTFNAPSADRLAHEGKPPAPRIAPPLADFGAGVGALGAARAANSPARKKKKKAE